jgi:hypothetical protein
MEVERELPDAKLEPFQLRELVPGTLTLLTGDLTTIEDEE